MDEDLSILGNLIKYLQQFPPDTKVLTLTDCSSVLDLEPNYKRVKLTEDLVDYDLTNKSLTIGN